MKLSIEIRRVMRDSVRLYFAPLTGAIKGARAEVRRIDRATQRHRQMEKAKSERQAARHA